MFTTSRYASQETRKAARDMARNNDEYYVARGKKTMDQIARLARNKGEHKVTIVEEKDGIATHLAVIKVDETGRWAWTEERLLNSTEKK